MYVRGKGVEFATVRSIVESVSDVNYAGNIIVHADAAPIRQTGSRLATVILPHGGSAIRECDVTGYGFRGRIIGSSSKGEGTRRSGSGRRGPWACWHAYRDVMRTIMDTYPHAVITTAHARYDGLAGFLSEYPRTARVNVGSMAAPAYMASLCECDES